MTETTETQKTSIKTGKPFAFEAQTCGRCGGSGQYSFNYADGSRCYGCDGHGIKLTKRGQAAQAYFRLLLSKRAIDLEPGDKIFESGPFTRSGWAAIESITPTAAGTLDIATTQCRHCGADGQTMYRIAATADEKRHAKRLAREFQARLTKSGTIRKGA